MRSRFVLAAFVLLSLHLALVPLAEATVPGSSPAPAPGTTLAAQSNEQPNQQRKRATKKQRQRTEKAKQQKVKQKAQQQRAKKGKPREAKPRNQQRAQDATPVSNLGQTSVPELPGGPLRGAQRSVAQAENPGERYIVVYANDRVNSRAVTTALAGEPGVTPTNIYEHAVKGFAGYLTPAAKQALERDPRVESVTKDQQRFPAAQRLPRGINRIDADLNPLAAINGGGPGLNVDIAIIDTGGDLAHPDLNIHAWFDCTFDPDFPGWDRDGHGTHVAGTAAAIDNGIGVVGVAPGAWIWSMRVEDDNGNMFDSYIIECMDAVARHAQTPFLGRTIDVANMSLGKVSTGDACNFDAFNRAVCGMVNAGVTTVVAAGNNNQNAATFNPANIDQVIAVSALADKDGQPGGLGGTFNAICQPSQVDDGKATFSNFGADVDIAAPGIDVLSTFPTYLNHTCDPSAGVGYDVLAGTSMASPHVAGAAALLRAANPSLSPAQVKAALLANRENVAMLRDPDGINEGVLNLGDPTPNDTAGPALSINAPASAKAKQRVSIRVNASDPSAIARVELYRCQPGCKKVAQDVAAPFRFVRRHPQPGRVKYKVRAVDARGNASEKMKTIRIKPAR